MTAHTERLIRQNAKVEHMLLSPFRWLRNFAIFIFVALICFIMLGYNATGWVVGLGSMGIRDRQERAAKFHPDTFGPDSGVSDNSTQFGSRGEPVSRGETKLYHKDSWVQGWLDTEGMPDYVPASGVDGKLFPFCSVKTNDHDPGMGLDGWFDRSRSVFGRKASRMYEAYVTGAVGVTALRVTLTELKLGRDPLTDLSAEPGQVNSLCHVDPFDVLTISDAEYQRWGEVSEAIKLDAPTVQVRMVRESGHVPFQELELDINGYHFHEGWMISGMLLEDDYKAEQEADYVRLAFPDTRGTPGPGDGRDFYLTMYADLFYSTPPLSEHQTHAVDALNHLATDDYWIAEAHKNGVYNDAVVKTMAARARYTISKMIAPDRVPDMPEGDESINPFGGQY